MPLNHLEPPLDHSLPLFNHLGTLHWIAYEPHRDRGWDTLNHPWTKWPPHAGPSVLFLNYRPLLGPPLAHLWTSLWLPFGPVFNHFKGTFQPPLNHFWTPGASLLNHFCITLGPLLHHFWITFWMKIDRPGSSLAGVEPGRE